MIDGRGPRALLLTLDFPPGRGGIQTMSHQICLRSAHVVAAVVPDAAEADPPKLSQPLVPYVRRGRPTDVAALAMTARRAVGLYRPDVVLAMHPLAAPAALLSRVPTVIAVHGGEFRSRRIRRASRLLLPRAERVVANSAFTRRAAVALGARPDRTDVLLVGAPRARPVTGAAEARLRAELGGGRIVLSVARLEPHKGHDVLLRALPMLPADVRMVFVGRGSAGAALEEQARAAGLGDRVVFAGSVDDEALALHYAVADCFALISRETAQNVEGGGIVLLEAMAYGAPVVAGATGGVPETVTDGETGLLVDPTDPAEVARAIGRALSDRPLASRLTRAGRALATGERSWSAYVRRLDEVLVRAAARERVGAP